MLLIDGNLRLLASLRSQVGVDSTAIAKLRVENEALRGAVLALREADTARLVQIEMLIASERAAIAKIDAALADRDKARRGERRAKKWSKAWFVSWFVTAVAAAVIYLIK